MPTSPVDLTVRVELCHAALQHVAVRNQVDLLHIKGMAFEPEWRSHGLGSDADVLVRPSHIPRFVAALEAGPWQRRSRFHTGSPFGHAQTYWHPHLGYADVHRFFPGMGKSESTFEVLWAERTSLDLASYPCPVPHPAGQVLIWALNEARNRPAGQQPPARLRELLESDLGPEITSLVRATAANVGWAAAVGQLELAENHPEHDLWVAVTLRSGRVAEWRARVKAEPRLIHKVLLTLRAPMVNVEHLTNTRGRRPTKVEIAREFIDRARRAAVEIRGSRRSRP